jgi:hypothetical protein
LNLFPAFPQIEQVFVAMSFDSRFDARWRDVIVPAAERLGINGVRLKAHRVDTRKVGDSILTEIVQGISQSRLVLADITSIGMLDDKIVRNGNVLYELGIAHATRLPEEVLIFRSDSDQLLFDVAGIRVNSYAPDDDAVAAREKVVAAIADAIREVDLRRSLAVRQALESLGGDGLTVLCDAAQGMRHFAPRTFGEIVANAGQRSAVDRLLDLRILGTAFEKFETGKKEMLHQQLSTWTSYRLTTFGEAVLLAAYQQLGFDQAVLDEHTPQPQPAE